MKLKIVSIDIRCNNQNVLPKITKDIYVKEVKGDLQLGKDGIIQCVIADAVITGTDDQGKTHEITFELLGKITDINSTKIAKPDLTGKKVENNDSQTDGNKLANPEMYVGTYKNDIAIVKDGKFQKIGEQILEIKSLDDKTLVGAYHEQYLNGNDTYAANSRNFDITAKLDEKNSFDYKYTAKDSLGKQEKGDLYIMPHSNSIGINLSEYSNSNVIMSGQLYRVFK